MPRAIASFSLEPKYIDLLNCICAVERRTATEQMRVLIDREAVRLGMEPVKPVAEKAE